MVVGVRSWDYLYRRVVWLLWCIVEMAGRRAMDRGGVRWELADDRLGVVAALAVGRRGLWRKLVGLDVGEMLLMVMVHLCGVVLAFKSAVLRVNAASFGSGCVERGL